MLDLGQGDVLDGLEEVDVLVCDDLEVFLGLLRKFDGVGALQEIGVICGRL